MNKNGAIILEFGRSLCQLRRKNDKANIYSGIRQLEANLFFSVQIFYIRTVMTQLKVTAHDLCLLGLSLVIALRISSKTAYVIKISWLPGSLSPYHL